MSEPVDDARVEIVALGNGRYLVQQGTSTQIAYAVTFGGGTWVWVDGHAFLVGSSAARPRTSSTDDADALAAPMPATVVRIEVTPGQTVSRDTLLVMLEAMKMELPIRAPRDGRIAAIHCRIGEIVQAGVPLLEIA